MLKQIYTLARGRMTDSSQAVLDANAVALLRQQIRDAAEGVKKSRTAVAVIIAYSEREKTSVLRIQAQIDDLETRTLDALAQEREDLATQAAGAIARLEQERDTAQRAIDTYQSQIMHLKQVLSESESCLRQLKQGQHLAEANDKANSVRGVTPSSTINDLQDAKVTLTRLQARQEHAQATASALVELSAGATASDVSEKLATEGCGPALHSSATSVLERLKQKATDSQKSPSK